MIGAALLLLLDPYVLAVMLAAAVFGLFVGAVPGLTATMATALLVPVTFFMDPVPAVAAIVTCSAMAITAGDIPATFLRIPGTPSSAAYVDDAYVLAQKGKAELALSIGIICSAIGGLFGGLGLIFLAPALARIALGFSTVEYFWLACLGLACAAFVSGGSPVKGALSLLIGLFMGTVGQDPVFSQQRFTFDVLGLAGGLGIVPVLIGLFAIPEIIRFAARGAAVTGMVNVVLSFRHTMGELWRTLWETRVTLVRGNVIGLLLGILPGAGADIAAWITYAISKKLSRTPEEFGKGSKEGLVGATAANNSALGGAFIPATVFGIPGDTITAIVIGVLFMKGLTPGPTIFIRQPETIYAIFLSFMLANVMMVPLGYAAVKAFHYALRVPRGVLMPIILMFCIVGAFAVENTAFSVLVMLGVGVLGYTMERNAIPLAPCVLGLVLGPLVENYFISSMIKADGNFFFFFQRPLAAVLGIATVVIVAYAIVAPFIRKPIQPQESSGA